MNVDLKRTQLNGGACWLSFLVERPKRRVALLADISGGACDRVANVIEQELAAEFRAIARRMELYIIPDGQPVVCGDATTTPGVCHDIGETVRNAKAMDRAQRRGTFISDALKAFSMGADDDDVAVAVVQNPIWDIADALRLMQNARFRLHIICVGTDRRARALLREHPELRPPRVRYHEEDHRALRANLFESEGVNCDVELTVNLDGAGWRESVPVVGQLQDGAIRRNDDSARRWLRLALDSRELSRKWDVQLTDVRAKASVCIDAGGRWQRSWALEQVPEDESLTARGTRRLGRSDALFAVVDQMFSSSCHRPVQDKDSRRFDREIVQTGAVTEDEKGIKYLLLCRTTGGATECTVVRRDDVTGDTRRRVDCGGVQFALGSGCWSAEGPAGTRADVLLAPPGEAAPALPIVDLQRDIGNAYRFALPDGCVALIMVLG